MKRRDMLKAASAAVAASLAFPLGWAGAAEGKKRKVLFFTRNVGYYHDVVRRKGEQLSHAEKALTGLGKDAGIEVVCTKDGRAFDGDLGEYGAFAFYANGDLTKPNDEQEPPMTPEGKQRLLDAVAGGKGFVGFHSACACWRTPGPVDQDSEQVDPYLAMLGGEFISHGPQQETSLTLTSRRLPAVAELGIAEGIGFFDEWYSLRNFAKDLHVILLQETRYMKGDCYRRPPYPCTWARRHGKGRVFFTSMGHTEEIWTNPFFLSFALAGLTWTLGEVDVELPPNLREVAPRADKLHDDKPS
jgi:type 1 glutamine amidotransferase